MDRRSMLKSLGLIAGGAMVLPSCDFFKEKAVRALNNLKINHEQEELVKQLVDTIIPAGEIPGALELGVHNFVWVMADDCLTPEEQQHFITGLEQFPLYTRKFSGDRFHKLETDQQPIWLLKILGEDSDLGETKPETNPEPGKVYPPEHYLRDIQFFLKYLKQQSIRGYMYSQYIMTEVMPYQLVPGTYDLCATINHQQRVNIHA